MRRLGQRLEVEAMSLYKYVSNKDDLLEGMVDLIVGEIDLPAPGDDWKSAMRRRAASVRRVLGNHPWASQLLDSHNPGPQRLRYYDRTIGNLRESGFSTALAAHAFATVDAITYGFASQEASMSFRHDEDFASSMDELQQRLLQEEYPHLTEMITEFAQQGTFHFDDGFASGLEMILDGLERRLKEE